MLLFDPCPLSRRMPSADTGFDVESFFLALHVLCREGTRIPPAPGLPPQLRFGYMHGATVMYLGNLAWHERRRDPSWPRAADWAWIHAVVCQADYYERRGKVGTLDETFDYIDIHYCYHGIGHAFIYHSYFHPIEKTGSICFEPPPLPLISNLTLTYDAARMCMSAPTDYYRRACSFGVFHSLSEWTFGWTPSDYHLPDERGVPQSSVFFPCDKMSSGGSDRLESAMCFDHVFRWLGWGFPGEPTAWIFEEIRSHVLGGKGLASLCLANPWSPNMEEGHVQSCVYGLSEVFFTLFDKFAAARTQADLRRAPMRERCCHSVDGQCSTLWGETGWNSYDMSLFNPYHSDYFNASTYTVPEAHCELLVPRLELQPCSVGFELGSRLGLGSAPGFWPFSLVPALRLTSAGFESRHGKWEGLVLPPTHVQNTLVTWCSNFVADAVRVFEEPFPSHPSFTRLPFPYPSLTLPYPPLSPLIQVRTDKVPLNAREWHRYLACVTGAIPSLATVPETYKSTEVLSRICPQLLDSPSWVPPALRRLAYDACDIRFHSDKEPHTTRYMKMDALAHAAWIAL